MKSRLITCGALLGAAMFTKSLGAQDPLSPSYVVEIADAAAHKNHINLSDYNRPAPDRLENGNWFILYQHKPRYGIDQYGKRRRIYFTDDCFWIDVNDVTKVTEFVPCA
ncbi:MAG: hypothetical protein ABI132_09205 [Rhodanobacteraceae bacterium]